MSARCSLLSPPLAHHLLFSTAAWSRVLTRNRAPGKTSRSHPTYASRSSWRHQRISLNPVTRVSGLGRSRVSTASRRLAAIETAGGKSPMP